MRKATEEEFELGIEALIFEVESTNAKTREILDRLLIDDVVAQELRAASAKACDDAVCFLQRWLDIEYEDRCLSWDRNKRDAILAIAVTWRDTVQTWSKHVTALEARTS